MISASASYPQSAGTTTSAAIVAPAQAKPALSPVVQAIDKLDHTGDICHPGLHLYNSMRFEKSGDINWFAVRFLGHLIYWHRSTEVKDPAGNVIGHKNKFKAHKYQANYDQLAEQFGVTKRQIQDTVTFLVNRVGVVEREIVDRVRTNNGVLGNVVYLTLVPEKLAEIYACAPIRHSNGTTTRSRLAVIPIPPQRDTPNAIPGHITEVPAESASDTITPYYIDISTATTYFGAEQDEQQHQASGVYTQEEETTPSHLPVMQSHRGKRKGCRSVQKPFTEQQQTAYNSLKSNGVYENIAQYLPRHFPLSQIHEQLRFYPKRNLRGPGGLVRSIQESWPFEANYRPDDMPKPTTPAPTLPAQRPQASAATSAPPKPQEKAVDPLAFYASVPPDLQAEIEGQAWARFRNRMANPAMEEKLKRAEEEKAAGLPITSTVYEGALRDVIRAQYLSG